MQRIPDRADRGDWPLFTANPARTPGLAMQVSSLPTGPAELLGPAVAAFLTERDLAPSSHRVYALTLNRLVAQLGPDMPVAAISTAMLARFLAATHAHLAAASHNRVAATLGSLFAYTTRQGWTPVSPAVSGTPPSTVRSEGSRPHPGLPRPSCWPS
jgi:hypothetical protein